VWALNPNSRTPWRMSEKRSGLGTLALERVGLLAFARRCSPVSLTEYSRALQAVALGSLSGFWWPLDPGTWSWSSKNSSAAHHHWPEAQHPCLGAYHLPLLTEQIGRPLFSGLNFLVSCFRSQGNSGLRSRDSSPSGSRLGYPSKPYNPGPLSLHG
jgi:hypothetical protein